MDNGSTGVEAGASTIRVVVLWGARACVGRGENLGPFGWGGRGGGRGGWPCAG